MIRTKLAVQQIALKVGIYAAFTASYWLAFWIRFKSGWIPLVEPFHPTDYVILFFVSIAAWGFLARTLKLDQLWLASNPVRWIKKGGWATLGTLMVVSFGAFFIRTYSFSRLFVGLLGCLNLFSLALFLRLMLSLAARHRGSNDEVRVLILGNSVQAEKVSERIRLNSWIRCRVVGYVAVTGDDVENGLPKLGELDDVESICRRYELDEILVAVPLMHLNRVPEVRKALTRVSVPSRLVCDFLQEVASGESILDFFGTPVVDLHRHPGDSLVYGLLKRSFDLVVATALLAALSPVMLLIAILVRLTSRGPILFSQKRVGLHGRPFNMYKFRTMYPQAERASDVVWTTPDDGRCTPLGKVLRKLNLDELPQLWNVVLGDMSLVGPRPERPFFVDKFAGEIEGYNVRHFLKSGITGWAQVNGWRGDTSIARRIEYDLYYLTNWSFALDLKILWLTLWRGFRDRNAY